MIVGILYGAVTNTPGLGAAQEALNQINYTGDPIALGSVSYTHLDVYKRQTVSRFPLDNGTFSAKRTRLADEVISLYGSLRT